MTNTKQWALSHGICVDEIVPPVDDYNEPCSRTAEEIAIRTIILHCLVAVGYGVDPEPVIEWLEDEAIWENASPNEQAFLRDENPSDEALSDARWRQEAQWALLWAIGHVEALGLPTQTCDTARLVDEIMPGLGEPIDSFVSASVLRSPAELLGEDDRTYNLHCLAREAYRDGSMPDDLVYDVLYQRQHALEWLSGDEDWDDVTTDT
ncbi:DUF4272 domain-containing protein [Rhodopirellula sp. MGV]|uniref:DUF4272 domain-containing protein n=1 Tax=Rhodopirellula sp. MGV TaxID=2023130 RepID=UPI000B96EE57|nr:DUF4272 domain-containing protein [Rhodopirellula sp. MGV]OYP30455.1 hypothetical protein CGZ80_22400 [Rhodopirellula sp. MGV]PNY35070.1 DUF4272 domain-containing protein [Rhodopirellula baltica]PNY36807.1 DUF4272 domain-containing protein [Rhodopirellula baltica]